MVEERVSLEKEIIDCVVVFIDDVRIMRFSYVVIEDKQHDSICGEVYLIDKLYRLTKLLKLCEICGSRDHGDFLD